MNTRYQVQEINEGEFEAEVLHSELPVLVGFLAGWSKPCQQVEPALGEVAETCNGKAKVLKVNVDDNPDLGTWYGIQSVPTLSYFINGTVRAKIVGMPVLRQFSQNWSHSLKGTQRINPNRRNKHNSTPNRLDLWDAPATQNSSS